MEDMSETNMEVIKDASHIPLEDIQELLLVRDEPDAFEKKVWEIVNKYQIPYLKVLAYFKDLTKEEDENKIEEQIIKIEKKEIEITTSKENIIPERLLDNPNIRFCRVNRGTKKPFEKDWTNKLYTAEQIKEFTSKENYGVLCGHGDIAVIDCDKEELTAIIKTQFPETFTVKTGSGGFHYYYYVPGLKSKIILEKAPGPENHLGEVQSMGTQVVGPGSLHPNGNYYDIFIDAPICKISLEFVYEKLGVFIKDLKEAVESSNYERQTNTELDNLSITSVWSISGMKKQGDEYYGSHPAHGSSGGMNFWINPTRNTWHCFRHQTGGGPLSAIAVEHGILDCSECHRGALRGEKASQAIKIAEEKYGLKIERRVSISKQIAGKVFSKRGQAEIFDQFQPLFYDKAGLFWLWNDQSKRWERVDDIDILNMVEDISGWDTSNSKIKNEVLNSLKQWGRRKIPKNIKPTWIQFQDKIVDIMTGEEFKSSPSYFSTNPIPWKLDGKNCADTPVMDKIFEEWVGKDFVKTLYEIIAYCTLPDYPIHRIFCFIGGGMNGKSKFLELLRRFIGSHNTCSTELDTLMMSRFEVTRLHKKLVCQMGETDFNELKKTSILKKLSGGDLMGFEYKNKDPFEEISYAKILISTNNLPSTSDKTIGFYRRWMIIDFPNTFSEKKDILNDIPEQEYEALACKCIGLLKGLLEKRSFEHEGSIEDRMKRYEDKSDPLEKFIKENCEEDFNEHISKKDFEKRLERWCNENKFRMMADNTIGKKMKQKNIESSRIFASWLFDGKGGQMYVWKGLRWKE